MSANMSFSNTTFTACEAAQLASEQNKYWFVHWWWVVHPQVPVDLIAPIAEEENFEVNEEESVSTYNLNEKRCNCM